MWLISTANQNGEQTEAMGSLPENSQLTLMSTTGAVIEPGGKRYVLASLGAFGWIHISSLYRPYSK